MKAKGILAAAAALGIAGCAAYPEQNAGYPDQNAGYPASSPSASYPASYPAAQAAHYGYVESVEVVQGDAHTPGAIGAIGGAIAGGVLGNQIGEGRGRTAATVAGAVAGGVAGNQIEQSMRKNNAPQQYRFRVRLDDGSYQTLTQDAHDNIRVGDRVRVENGRVWAS
jgi:outer membrane lipoprotein SlyB